MRLFGRSGKIEQVNKAGDVETCPQGHHFRAQKQELEEGRCPICVRNLLRRWLAVAPGYTGMMKLSIDKGRDTLMPGLIEQAEAELAALEALIAETKAVTRREPKPGRKL